MEDPWRAFPPTRSMRNAGSNEKEDWLETEFGSSVGRRRFPPPVGRGRLTKRGNPLRLSVLYHFLSLICPLSVSLSLSFFLFLSSAKFSMDELCAKFAIGISIESLCNQHHRDVGRWLEINASI